MRKFLKISAIIIGAIVLLLVVGGVVVYLTVDLDKIINAQKDKYLPQVEQKIGRKITVGDISTTFLTGLGFNVANVRVSPNPNVKEDDRPVLEIANVGVKIDTIKAIVTFGQKLEVSKIYLDGFKTNIIRMPDGSLSIDDIQRKLAEGKEEKPEEKKAEPEKPTKLTKEQIELLKKITIGYIGIENASFRFLDLATGGAPAESFINDFDFVIKDLRITDPIKFDLKMAAFAQKQNVFIEVVVGPLPQDLDMSKGLPPIPKVSVNIQNVALGNIAPYLGDKMPLKITSAEFSMNYNFTDLKLDKPLPIKGFVELKNLVLKGGKPFNFRVDTDLMFDNVKMGADINNVTIKIGDIAMAMKGKFADLKTAPQFKGFTFETKNLNIDKLVSYYPEMQKSFPPGFKFSGDIVIDVKADGDANNQKVALLFDASNTHLFLPDQLDKRVGEPFKLVVDGEFSQKDALIKNFAFNFGKFTLGMKGSVKDFAKPTFDLELNSNKFTVNDMARLSPAVQKSIPPNININGAGEFKVALKGSLENLDAMLDFYLSDVDLKVPEMSLVGNLGLKVTAKGNPNANMAVKLDMDMDKATIIKKDTIDKASGTPLNMHVDIVRKAEVIEINSFNFALAELNLSAKGWVNYASNSLKIDLGLKPLPLDKFAKTIVAMRNMPTAGGILKFNVHAEGNPNKMETVSAALTDFEFKMGKNIVKTDFTFSNPDAPDITFNIDIPYFNLDDIYPPEKYAASSEEKKEEPKDNPFLEKITLKGKMRMGQFIANKFPISNFIADVRMEKGDFILDQFSLETYKGKISGTGTRVNLSKAYGPYDVHFSIAGLDVNALLTAQSSMKNTLYGTLTGKLDMKGVGLDGPHVQKNATGKFYSLIQNGRYDGANVTQAIAEPIVSKIPGAKADKKLKDKGFKKLEGDFDIRDGRMWLKKPMVLDGPDGTLKVDGSIGLDATLQLKGTYEISPATAGAMIGGKCKIKEPVPVPLKIGGTIGKPKLTGIEADKPAKVIAQACLGKEISEAVGAAKEKAEEKVEEAKQKVEEKKEEAKKEVKEKAKKEKEKAKKKAKEKAKGKLKNKLGF